ncbi:MAG: DNA integrity scanning protein DisA [Propionibacterium sp.]|nr:DNA integrity scanning protein DisA [Propionibacterium sp.]
MSTNPEQKLRRVQALIAPGTPLREGLERILRGQTGALVVLGAGRAVTQLSTGGFELDTPFTPTALRELAKMDGAIIVTADLTRIVAAGVHLMPSSALVTDEVGTRHRTADRVSQQTGVPVVTVSSSMSTIALFLDGHRHLVDTSFQIISRANQALATYARYTERLLDVSRRLSILEAQDQVTLKDLAHVLQRLEMVRRLGHELEGYVVELGTDGRLLALQLHELEPGTDELLDLLLRDYPPTEEHRPDLLAELSSDELLDPQAVARAAGYPDPLDARLTVHGYRQLAQIQRLPTVVAERLLEHFGGLQGLMGATMAELLDVEGIGDSRARLVRDGLMRLSESIYET